MESIYIAAGGTGGHINAALSLAENYSGKYDVHFITGTRYLDYQLFKDKKVLHVDSKPLRVKNPIILILNLIRNLFVFLGLIKLFLVKKPKFLIGAGGYVCGPSLLAGWLLGKPVFIIEQNAALGLTNKLLSKIAKRIFVHFEKTRGLTLNEKVIIAGNPIRKSIKHSEQKFEAEKIKVLVYGGSLGAKQINEAVSLFSKQINERYIIKHQVGKNNINKSCSTEHYMQLEYINDMQQAYDWANVIIARAGASTVAELKVVGKPSILIPFPGHADNHQVHNAQELKRMSDFEVRIIDNKLEGLELKDSIEKNLNEINYSNKTEEKFIDNSFEIINKEIEKCMA